jgi:hypothetical protein
MNSIAASISALALVATAPSSQIGPVNAGWHEAAPGPDTPRFGLHREQPSPFRVIEDSFRAPVQNQVRIEQRVIIRVGPSRSAAREEMLARLPSADRPTRYKEKKLSGCIPIEDIAGVQPAQENRLLLFMRDNRVLSAALERACDAEAFYLGFYVERSSDGMLCSKRDMLQARTGASCEIVQLNRLVAIKD